MSPQFRSQLLNDYIDKTDRYDVSLTEININSVRFAIATLSGPHDGGQLAFLYRNEQWDFYDADNFIDVFGQERARTNQAVLSPRTPISDDAHAQAFKYIKSCVGAFATSNGPGQGNLACVWTVRHILYDCLKRWVTRVDGTALFAMELERMFGVSFKEDDVPEGGIIISPTAKFGARANIGNVGLLGPRGSSSRLVYSNSPSLGYFSETFSVSSWKEKYSRQKGLKTLFFPLPA